MPITGAEAGSAFNVKRSVWRLPDDLDRETLAADLGRNFALEPAQAETDCFSWFDTFDWRLFRRDLFLCHDGVRWKLTDKSSGRADSAAAVGAVDNAVFPVDLPPGRIRDQAGPLVKMRCLRVLFAENLTRVIYRILNRDDKTVALVVFDEHCFLPAKTVCRTLSLQGVRGYDTVYDELLRFVEQFGIRDTIQEYAFFVEGAGSRGRVPLDYSSKFTLELKPEMSALQAMKKIYRQLFATMQRNEAGMKADLDSEFLHDFRVAVRRTRSGLGQVNDVLPAAVTRDFKEKFAWLGRITGPTRDLDVYLLNEDNYLARLPECLHEGLNSYFAEIRARREGERKKLVRHLNSKKFRQVLHSWQTWIDSEDTGDTGDNAFLPVPDLAGAIVLKRYRKIIAKGAGIGPSSPASELHRLRIQCKKLRYILEFFASLYPEKEIRRVIKQLRRLQTNLGDFNDLSVQLEMLRHYLASLRPGSRKHQEIAAALGGLLTNLYHEHRRVRGDFTKRYREFSRPENSSVYFEFFGPRKMTLK